jgi:hypothetical protein
VCDLIEFARAPDLPPHDPLVLGSSPSRPRSEVYDVG